MMEGDAVDVRRLFDADLAAWLDWKARALTQGRIELVVAQLLRALMEEEIERRSLGLDDEQPMPTTAWSPLVRENALRAHPD